MDGDVKEIARLLQLGAGIDATDWVRDVCHERVMLGNRKVTMGRGLRKAFRSYLNAPNMHVTHTPSPWFQ